MIAMQQNSIDLRFFMPSFEFKFQGSFVNGVRDYIKGMRKIYFIRRAFRFMIDDFDSFIDSNNLNTLENLKKVSDELYQIEETLEKLLEIDGFLFYPMRRAIQETIYDCSSLATLLTGIEAELRVSNGDR